ncbi:MAG: iron(III) transport system permease protein [Actinomycetes bacterium]|jgi:iron(III) transport system permease protein
MNRATPRSLLVIGGTVAAVVCVPLVYLVIRALGSGWGPIEQVLSSPNTWRAAGTSVALAVAVSGTTVAIGVPAAWLITKARLRWRRLWVVLVVLPLAVPSFVAAFAWLSLFPPMTGFWAAWLVLSLATVPYVILPTAAALRSLDPAHEEVARTLGARPREAFLRAALPQVSPAVGGGALLVALYVLSDFGAVSIFRVDVLSRVIYSSYRASFDRTSAAVLGIILALLAILIVAIEQRSRGRAQRWRLATSAPRQLPPVVLTREWRSGGYGLLAAVAILGVGVPVGATIEQFLTGASAGIDWPDLGAAMSTTALYGVVGMVAAVVLALPIGLLAARYPTRASAILERMSFVGHALPGVVVGLSVVFLGTRLVPGIYQTLPLLAFAYAVLFIPKAGAAIRGSIATVPTVLEDVARTCGYSPWRAFRTVTMRLASPGIAAGAVLVLLTVMKELPATLMLRPTGDDTLATRLWSLTEIGSYAAAAPYAMTLILIGAIPAFLLAFPLARSVSQYERPENGEPSDERGARMRQLGGVERR